MFSKKLTWQTVVAALQVNIMLITSNAYAATGGMPWENPLQKIADSISGPFLKSVAIVAIVGTGVALAFGEGGGGARRGLWIVFGLSSAYAATTFFSTFFGTATGVMF